jgi:predicted nucleic acid-binding protein
MKVLVDTSVWSLALRRSPRSLSDREHGLSERLAGLVRDDLVTIIGPIRQEVLSGIRSAEEFERLRLRLREFGDEDVVADDYELAAQTANACRTKGIAGSAVDFLICAVCIRRDLAIFTTDRDFTHYATAVPLKLYMPELPPSS